jgi:pantoate--beta-alanine ligase
MRQRRTLTLTTPDSVLDATIGAMTIGLVPIMGSMHDGHMALIRRSHHENDETVVVIFDPSGDVPTVSQEDIAAALEAGARIFYRPEPETIFPSGFSTSVRVPDLASRWEGEARKGHFDRVTAFFVILLNQLQPTRTYVGEKHLQQLRILQRVHHDLGLSGEIVPCVTVRDPDGLPLSSYNATLYEEERAAALAIPQALFAVQQAAIRGERNHAALIAIGRQLLNARPLLQVDYLAMVDAATFDAADEVSTGDYAIVAGTVGETRILDAVHLDTATTGSPDS